MEKNIFVVGPVVTLDTCPYVKSLVMAKGTAQWWICLMTNNDNSRSLLGRLIECQYLKQDPRHVVGYCPLRFSDPLNGALEKRCFLNFEDNESTVLPLLKHQ
jgi:hypothetical protein